jgi:hypothetical protein
MGFYPDGKIYGLSWTIYDISKNEIKREEYTQKNNLEPGNITDIKKHYEKLNVTEKNNITIQFYAKCESGHELSRGKFMCWIPGDVKTLESFFSGSDVKLPRWHF